MSAKQAPRPSVETWYKTSNGDMFEVVAIDVKDEAIQIQYLDGSVEELDGDDWESLDPTVIDPPREAIAEAYDEGESEYDDVADHEGAEGDWSGPLEDYE